MLIVASSAVVAISARGFHLILPPADLSADWIWGIRIMGGLAGTAAIIGLLLWNRKARKGRAAPDDPVAGPLRRAGIIMALLVFGGLLVNPLAPTGDSLRPGPRPTRQEPSSDPNRGEEAPPPSGIPGDRAASGGLGGGGQGSGGASSLGAGAQQAQTFLRRLANSLPFNVLLLGVAVILFVLLRRRRRRSGVSLSEFPWEPEDAEAGLMASLAEVSGRDRDPRGQITAAYLRLLSALSEAGAPRKTQEAPHEHLRRTLGPLGVRTKPLHELTTLYVMAQFSLRPVTDRHRAAAVKALEASLASIRAKRATLESESPTPLLVEAPV
jgi:hypothetical protein